jgi:hypothetical protein
VPRGDGSAVVAIATVRAHLALILPAFEKKVPDFLHLTSNG